MKRVVVLIFLIGGITECLWPQTSKDRTSSNTQTTVITGRLLGHDAKPLPKAGVHLLRFNESKPLVSVEAAKNGNFKIETTETGLFTLQLTGVNHKSHEVVLLVEKKAEINLNAHLESYDYLTNFNNVKIIGDFNNFSFDSAKPMEKQPDGTYVADFEVNGNKFLYQLIGLTTSGASINGTQSEDYVYDGGGDYRSIITPRNGRVRVIFDPNKLVRSRGKSQITFRDENSFTTKFTSIYEAMLKRRKSVQAASNAFKKKGKTLDEFKYNWSLFLRDLSKQIRTERNPQLRQALLVSYLDLGYGTYGAKLNPVLARQALAEIPATSPLWSIEPRLLGVALNNTGKPENYDSYIQQIVENHFDATVKRIVKAEYAPTRNIMVGRSAPPFSLTSLIDPKTVYTSENLKGKTVLIDFWATWCLPCVEEMPNLHKEYEKFKGKNFEILSVSLDDNAEIVRKFQEQKWRMPWLNSLISSDKNIRRQFEIVGIPKTVLIDPNGKIIATQTDLRGQRLDETLTRVLEEFRRTLN